MYKYKLINKNKEILCFKVTIEEYDYYVEVNNDDIYPDICTLYYDIEDGFLVYNGDSDEKISPHYRKVIATNNHESNLPKVIDTSVVKFKEHFNIGSDEKFPNTEGDERILEYFSEGYDVSQSTHQFTEYDMIEFHKWAFQQVRIMESDLTTKELLEIWKSNKIKTIYYE